MKRLYYGNEASGDDVVRCHETYERYLDEIKDEVSTAVLDFAAAPWHYDPSDDRCLHDGTLESFEIREVEDRDTRRAETIINLMVFNSRKSMRTHLCYKGVKYYTLEKVPLTGVLAEVITVPTTYHGEWLIDEIHLSENGLTVHEIEFSFGAAWKIYFEDLEYNVVETDQGRTA